jgi:hypothetical protein
VSLRIAEIHFKPRAAGQAHELQTPPHTVSPDPVRRMIENVEDKVKILAETDPGARAAVYPLLAST